MNTAASAAIERAKRRPARPRPCRRRPPAPESGDTGATPPTPTRWRPGPISPPTPSRGGTRATSANRPRAIRRATARRRAARARPKRRRATTPRPGARPPARRAAHASGGKAPRARTRPPTGGRATGRPAARRTPAPPRRERQGEAENGERGRAQVGAGHVVSVSRRSAPARSHRGAFRAVQWSWWCRWPCAASGVAEGRAVGCAALGGTGRGPAADDDGPPCCACPCCLPGAAWPPGP